MSIFDFHLGKFKCNQCHISFPYSQIIGEHYYICLDCYAWARGVFERNEGKEWDDREINILLISSRQYALFGTSKMLTLDQADYILDHEEIERPAMNTCTVCHKYYRGNDCTDGERCPQCFEKVVGLVGLPERVKW